MKYLWFKHGAYASQKGRRYVQSEFNPVEIKTIAVLRHAALGDQVILRPFLVELRKFFPNAKITLSASSDYQYGMPIDLVDNTHIMIGKDRKDAGIMERIKNAKALGEQDIIFDLASTNRSYWMMALCTAKLKIGYPYHESLRRLLYDICVLRTPFQPEVESLLDMLRVFGHNPSNPLDFAYPHNRLEREVNKPFILYFNGASQQSKILEKKEMFEIIKLNINKHPSFQHIYLEGRNDYEKGDFLEDLKSEPNFQIQPCLDLDKLINLVAQSSLLVSPDTGVRNVAISTHTPTVGIFYSTSPFSYTPRYEPHFVVSNAKGNKPTPSEVLACIDNAINDLYCINAKK